MIRADGMACWYLFDITVGFDLGCGRGEVFLVATNVYRLFAHISNKAGMDAGEKQNEGVSICAIFFAWK